MAASGVEETGVRNEGLVNEYCEDSIFEQSFPGIAELCDCGIVNGAFEDFKVEVSEFTQHVALDKVTEWADKNGELEYPGAILEKC